MEGSLIARTVIGDTPIALDTSALVDVEAATGLDFSAIIASFDGGFSIGNLVALLNVGIRRHEELEDTSLAERIARSISRGFGLESEDSPATALIEKVGLNAALDGVLATIGDLFARINPKAEATDDAG